MKVLNIFLICMFLSMACKSNKNESGNESGSGNESESGPGTSPSSSRKISRTSGKIYSACQNVDQRDGTNCLKLVCEKAGGEFKGTFCKCPEGQIFSGWFVGTCSPLKFINFGDGGDNAYIGGKTQGSLLGTMYSGFPDGLARWVQSGRWTRRGSLVSPSFYRPQKAHTQLIKNKNELTVDLFNESFQYQELLFVEGQRQDFERFDYDYKSFYYTPTEREMQLAIAVVDNRGPEVSSGLLNSLGLSISPEKLEDMISRNKNWKYSFITPNGCLDYCKRTYELNLDETEFKHVQEFIGGVVIKNYIVAMKNGNPSSRSFIILTTSNLVSLGAVNSMGLQEKDWAQGIDFFSPAGEHLKRASTIIIKGYTTEKQFVEEMRSSTALRSGGIVLCDTGLLASKVSDEGLDQNILVGEKLKSFFGWADGQGLSSKFAGVFALNEDLIVQEKGDIKYHAYSMAKMMKRNNIVPMTINFCFKEIDSWRSSVAREGVKVVNVSYATSKSHATCKDTKEVKNIKKGKNFLWVFAAGNDAKRYPKKESAPMCPQNSVSGDRHVLVVGASSDTHRINISASGKDFVDLFADASSTSIATAKVSSSADVISQNYPSLTPSQLRVALLLGSDNYTRNSSRVSGKLNEEGALVVAKLMAENPLLSNVEIYKMAYQIKKCGEKSTDASYWDNRKWKKCMKEIEDDGINIKRFKEGGIL